MLKNSEWGVVVYLTHSQYGRNGYKIEENNNENFITADEGVDINPKQSTTGNIYGIYDFSGGAREYVTAYYNGENLSNGSSLTKGTSDEFSTAYTGTIASQNHKIGDATYETSGWNGDLTNFVDVTYSFFLRGGYYAAGSNGIFYYGCSRASSTEYNSFRICFAIK